MAFAELIFDNFFLEMQMGCYLAQPSPVPPDTHLELLHCPTSENDVCTISTGVACSPYTYYMWTLYFDGSKT